MKNALKNRVMFLGGTATVGVVAIFIVLVVGTAATVGVPRAHAYAIGSTSTDITGGGTGASAGSAGTAGGSYDFTNSLQNLISPFTKFMSDLNFSSNTTINIHGQTSGFPVTNFTPMVESGAQNILSQWGTDFDNWFYGISGIHLSGILFVILNAIAWTLHLAEAVVNWLLGLFH